MRTACSTNQRRHRLARSRRLLATQRTFHERQNHRAAPRPNAIGGKRRERETKGFAPKTEHKTKTREKGHANIMENGLARRTGKILTHGRHSMKIRQKIKNQNQENVDRSGKMQMQMQNGTVQSVLSGSVIAVIVLAAVASLLRLIPALLRVPLLLLLRVLRLTPL